MIIGISGKKQHGKDTVANIIQYLSFNKRYPGHSHTLGTFSKENDGWKNLESTWYRKQFASKLKQIVALLIGCEVKDLEDNKFKEQPLGEQWKVWYWTHHKDGETLGPIYTSEEEAKAKHLNDGTIHLKSEVLTPRKLLQLVGTECGREILHPNIWINALMTEYKVIGYNAPFSLCGTGKMRSDYPPIYPDWIITDVRFPNEIKAIEDRGGIVIRVFNPRIIPVDNHPSETSLDNYPFEKWIYNNGTLEELVQRVIEVLQPILYGNKE